MAGRGFQSSGIPVTHSGVLKKICAPGEGANPGISIRKHMVDQCRCPSMATADMRRQSTCGSEKVGNEPVGDIVEVREVGKRP